MCRFDPATAETETSFVRKPTGKPRKENQQIIDKDDETEGGRVTFAMINDFFVADLNCMWQIFAVSG